MDTCIVPTPTAEYLENIQMAVQRFKSEAPPPNEEYLIRVWASDIAMSNRIPFTSHPFDVYLFCDFGKPQIIKIPEGCTISGLPLNNLVYIIHYYKLSDLIYKDIKSHAQQIYKTGIPIEICQMEGAQFYKENPDGSWH